MVLSLILVAVGGFCFGVVAGLAWNTPPPHVLEADFSGGEVVEGIEWVSVPAHEAEVLVEMCRTIIAALDPPAITATEATS